jgi:hypothetical protein
MTWSAEHLGLGTHVDPGNGFLDEPICRGDVTLNVGADGIQRGRDSFRDLLSATRRRLSHSGRCGSPSSPLL